MGKLVLDLNAAHMTHDIVLWYNQQHITQPLASYHESMYDRYRSVIYARGFQSLRLWPSPGTKLEGIPLSADRFLSVCGII